MIQIIPSELKRLYKVLPRLYRLRLLKVGISVFIMAVFGFGGDRRFITCFIAGA